MRIDKNIIERQIDSDGCIEDSYRLDSTQGLLLYNELAQKVPQYLNLVHDIELISKHSADDLSYKEESICFDSTIKLLRELTTHYVTENTIFF